MARHTSANEPKEQSTEDRKMALEKKESGEIGLNLTSLANDIILLVADNLNPSAIVLLGLTCHRFYTIFSAQIATISLTAPIWDQYTVSYVMELHQVLKDWAGLAGYKYFDDQDLSVLSNTQKPCYLWSVDLSLLVWTAYTGYPSQVHKIVEPVPEHRRKKFGGLFFKCPRGDGLMKYTYSELSEEEKLDIAIFMKSWTPGEEVMRHEFDKHRRLRWSQYLMTSYAEWMDLVGF